jgi:hypothetical protein
MTTTAQCPHCHELNTVAPSTIGRYVTCEKCKCKFWVYVPPLEEGAAKGSLVEPPSAAASLGHHHHGDSPGMIRQESLLATIHDDLLSLRRQIAIACLIFVAGCAAVITTLLLR